MKQDAPNIQLGDVVYFKELKISSKRDSLGVRFQGLGFGLVLGEVPIFSQRDISKIHVQRVLGSIGYICFDDVEAAIGPEQTQLVMDYFEKQYAYSNEEIEEIKKQLEPKSDLLNAQGKSVHTPEPPKIVTLKGESLEELKSEET